MLADLNNVQQTDISVIHKHLMSFFHKDSCFPIYLLGKQFAIIDVPTTARRVFVFCRVSKSRIKAYYPTPIGKDFSLWLLALSTQMKRKYPHLKCVSQV